MSQGLSLEWAYLTTASGDLSPGEIALRGEVIAPVLSELGDSFEKPPISAPLPDRAGDAAVHMQRLLSLPLVCADISLAPEAVLYLLGARELTREALTIAFAREGSAGAAITFLGKRLIRYDPGSAEHAKSALKALIAAYLQDDDDALSLLKRRASPIQVSYATSRRAERHTDVSWQISAPQVRPDTRVGVWAGDINEIERQDGIDVVFNSESTFLEMARFHDTGVSAVVRTLGSHWTRNNEESDDYIYRKLIEAAPSKRPVAAGTAILTDAGRLRDRGVKAVCHVAAVQPRGWGKGWVPGSGYEPVSDLGACVHAAFHKVDSANLWIGLPKSSRVLMPIFGSGNARAEPEIVVPRLLSAAIAYFRANPKSRISEVLFSAYSERERLACVRAFDQSTQLQRIAR